MGAADSGMQVTMETNAFFASAERLSLREAKKQAALVRNDVGLRRVAGSIPDLLAVLNQHRQVVYANRPLLDFLEEPSLASICGARPGELLQCVHASDVPGGCGASGSCRFCGAARAIVETQRTGKPSSEECTITAAHGGSLRAHNFQVTVSPLEVAGGRYLLLSLRDISADKHRQALQRIFFHDLLNTVSGLKVHLDLLRRQAEGKGCGETIERLERIGDHLVEEIRSQKLLVSAESGTLEVQKNLILSTNLARELVEEFAATEEATHRKVALAPFYESVSFISDEAILRRILTNMIKNALEASVLGETVNLGCRKEEKTVVFWVHNRAPMDPGVQHQVFQRFFTTKGPGRGLGTYSMKLLAEEYLAGRVYFESSPEGGTTFTLSLPGGAF